MALILSKRAKDKYDAMSVEDLSCFDPIYFIEHHLELPHRRRFDLNDEQLHLVTRLHDDFLVVCKQDRGVGVTLASIAYALWYAQFHSNVFCLFVLPTSTMAAMVRDQALAMFGSQSANVGASMTYYNRAEVRFDNGSRIHFSRLHDNVGTGYLTNLIVLGDVTVCNSEEVVDGLKSLLPAIPADGRLLIHGYPTTQDHFFFDLWQMGNIRSSRINGRTLHPVDLGGDFV
jgi:hypothetical protein